MVERAYQLSAGDRIQVEWGIVYIFEKKGGALEFVVMESRYTNQDGKLTTRATSTMVVRNG